jgi:hypothetical protein
MREADFMDIHYGRWVVSSAKVAPQLEGVVTYHHHDET